MISSQIEFGTMMKNLRMIFHEVKNKSNIIPYKSQKVTQKVLWQFYISNNIQYNPDILTSVLINISAIMTQF